MIWQEIGEQAKDLDTEFALIYEQVHSINILVNKLLQFARPEEFAGHVGTHAPDAVIDDTLPLVQHLLGKSEINLERIGESQREVAINRTELQQILINLIVNAIQAMPNGGTLRIEIRDEQLAQQRGVLIAISDTGIGMPPDTLARIFDPFFTTKKAEGTGLGLSISQELVSRSGGRIWAESETGKGTEFFIFLESSEGATTHECI